MTGRIGSFTDVTEIRQAERMASAAEERLRLAIEVAQVQVLHLDREHRITWMHNNLLGLSDEEMIGKPILEYVEEDARDQFRELWDAAFESDKPVRLDTVVDVDGDVRAFHLEASAMPSQDARAEQITVATIEVTEQYRMVAELRLQAAITENMAEGVTLIDADGSIAYVNERFEQLMGYERGELLGRQFSMLVPVDRTASELSEVRRVTEELFAGQATAYETRLARKDGRPVLLSISASMLEHGDQERAFIAVHRDITTERETTRSLALARLELERQNRDLQRSNADLEKFAYVASHDLQEPLRVIRGFVELLAQRYRGRLDDDADSFIAATVSGVERMGELIEDLLALSRIGRGEVDGEPVDTRREVERVLEQMGGPIEERGVAVELGELPAIEGDRALIAQLFGNLISNAVKFSAQESPRVWIGGAEEDGGWHFLVADNGAGIEPRHRTRIFEMFKRLHGREVPGTGIGLAICRRAVERHAGRIWVESADGAGSEFHFTIRRQPGRPGRVET